ncbi:MAG: hypothetical protein GDA43_20645 [Hormoscilla sp. SP5CHS1]|nr:hypothetical protein [Hormoscilla sp. SP12CHS1]MBC6455311.1 hypothetical protein [Hormoscilla sp. SP5CHS1]
MLSTTDMRSYAISLIVQLSQERLIAVVQLLECLVEPPQQYTMSAEETQLLEAIGHHLPEDERVRLNILRDRCEFGELSETEHQELIRYEDLLEEQRVKRLEALIQLAKIRNIDLMQLNQQVGA